MAEEGEHLLPLFLTPLISLLTLSSFLFPLSSFLFPPFKNRKQCSYKPGSVSYGTSAADACHLSNMQVTLHLKRSTLHRS